VSLLIPARLAHFGPQPTLRPPLPRALLLAKEVHHGLFLLFESESATDELQPRTTANLPCLSALSKTLQMRCAIENARLHEAEAEEIAGFPLHPPTLPQIQRMVNPFSVRWPRALGANRLIIPRRRSRWD
jgi:hypothetical protein